MDFLFHFSAAAVLPFWGMMLFFPNKPITQKVIASPWIIVAPAICYALLLIPNITLEQLVLFQKPSPNALAEMMKLPWAASMFWAYAGAFDLFVGRWMFFDSKESSIPHLIMVPILFVSIFFGPIGFLMYWIAKMVKTKKLLP